MTARAALPIEPLWNIVSSMNPDAQITQEEFARRCNTTAHAVMRWKKQGGIPWVSADEAAIAVGLHPMLVWGDDWLNVKGDFDRLARQATAELERQMVDAISTESMED